MALPFNQPLAAILALDADQLFQYFSDNARFIPDAPNKPYAIRLGNTTFFSNDTYDLRLQFNRAVGAAKRRRKKR